MHVHARTLGGNFGATIGQQTIEVDGTKVFPDGRLTILGDRDLAGAAQRCGVEDWPPA
jgi:hypothetical protein